MTNATKGKTSVFIDGKLKDKVKKRIIGKKYTIGSYIEEAVITKLEGNEKK